MKRTQILHPLDDDMPFNETKLHKDTWKNIKKYIDEMNEGDDISFDQLLLDLDVTEDKLSAGYKIITECVHGVFKKKSK